MSIHRSPGPPRFLSALLRLVLPPTWEGDAVAGDLEELWRERRATRGASLANLWYCGQVLGSAVRLLPRRLGEKSIMDEVGKQLRHGTRRLLRAPLFTAVAILTLAVGIGANAAIFSVVDGVLLKPLAFKEPERLVGIWHRAPGLGVNEGVNAAPALHYTYAAESHAFEGVGMWQAQSMSVTGLGDPEQVQAMQVTWQALPVLGIEPFLGRGFTEEEDTPAGPRAVILSYGYWQSHFGGDRSAVGKTLTVDGEARDIVGVTPRGLHFLNADPALFLTIRWDQSRLQLGNFSYGEVGRLRPGATVAEANADVNRMIRIADQRYPGGFRLADVGFAADVHPLKEDVVGDVGNVLWVLLGTVGIILLIACANVANLVLVRAESRQREIAVRTALGAGRGRIAGELLLESLFLGLLGGAAGLGLASAALRLLVAVGPANLPRLDEIGVNATVLAFTFAVSILASALVGIFPAIRSRGPDVVSALKEGGRGSSGGRSQHRVRDALVVTQIALALVLLAGSGLMVRSFRALRSVDPGFADPDQVVTFRVAIPEGQEPSPTEVALDFQQMLQEVRALPGVAAASLTSSVTMDGDDSNDPIVVEGLPSDPDELPPLRRYKFIGEAYHATMGNPVIAGRSITGADVRDRARVALITEDLAREYWKSPADAVGKRIRQVGKESENPWFEVVGVVGNVHDDGIDKPTVTTVFWPRVVSPFWGNPLYVPRNLAFVVRARSGEPTALMPGLRQAVWSVKPTLPVAQVATLTDLEARSMARTSFTLVMLALAAGVALFLGSVGIYGVVSYGVSQRTREIGVRMAMGAESVDVARMVLRQAAGLAGLGIAAGFVASLGLTRLMASLLYGVSPSDPLTFASMALLLTLVTLLASWIPAYRASRLDPLLALRFE